MISMTRKKMGVIREVYKVTIRCMKDYLDVDTSFCFVQLLLLSCNLHTLFRLIHLNNHRSPHGNQLMDPLPAICMAISGYIKSAILRL